MKDLEDNLKGDILRCLESEHVIGVVLGHGDGSYGEVSHIPNYSSMPFGKLLSWDEALKWIDYDYYGGFGTGGCQCFYMWTEQSVLLVEGYDGTCHIVKIPRNPIDVLPVFIGG